jgi:hypothetical protein
LQELTSSKHPAAELFIQRLLLLQLISWPVSTGQMAQLKTPCLSLMAGFAVVHAAATFSLATLSVLASSPRTMESNKKNLNTQSRKYLARYLGGLEDESSESTTDEVLSLERIEKLNEIGFVWVAHEGRFFQKLHELKLYKKNHGDTLVPRYYSENPSLGHWVHDRRIEYRYYHKKKALEEKWGGVEVLEYDVAQELERLTKFVKGMTEERIKILEREGFVWDVHSYAWKLRFQELQSIIDVYGHAPISRIKNYDPLAKWVKLQRMYYRKYLNGQLTNITEEKIELLNSIGFKWHQPRVKRRSQTRIAATT